MFIGQWSVGGADDGTAVGAMTIAIAIAGTYIEGSCLPGTSQPLPHSILNSKGEGDREPCGTSPLRMGAEGLLE